MEIKETTFGPKNYLVWKSVAKMTEIQDKAMWEKGFKMVYEYTQKNNVQGMGPGVGLYLTWDEEKGETEIGIGFEVGEEVEVNNPELTFITVPESKAVQDTLIGDYSGLKDLHGKLMEYTTQNNITPTLTIEEYTNDPSMTAPEELEANVYYIHD